MILKVAVFAPLWQLLDYTYPKDIDNITIGIRVKVPLGRREVLGVVIEIAEYSSFDINQLKPIIQVLDDAPILTDNALQLAYFLNRYYHYPLGQVLETMLPVPLRKAGKNRIKAKQDKTFAPVQPVVLNKEQEKAIHIVENHFGHFQAFLLKGVTGSGKTEVYLYLAEKILKNQQQIMIIVPEIGLTPQFIHRVESRLACESVVIHSALTPNQRLNAWLNAKNGTIPLVIGTRSALFTPLPNLGLIIVDEEHDSSFKQQDGLRYHARDVAVWYAKYLKIPIILGSATPSLESLYNVSRGAYQLLELSSRIGKAKMPTIHLIDLRAQFLSAGLSNALLYAMQETLARGEQVLLFLNRRGYAPMLVCENCGWLAECASCDAKLVLHAQQQRLKCHHCLSEFSLPEVCPNCQQEKLKILGSGTERLEEVITERFAEFTILRIDRDTTKRKGSMDAYLAQIRQGEAQIIIGTQMLAKGHDFPNVTLVGLLGIDYGFFSIDFRATEQIAQLITQVSGRAGRGDKPGQVFIQTYHPDHILLQTLLQQGYDVFSQVLLQERQETCLPPFTSLVILRAEAKELNKALEFLELSHNLAIQLALEEYPLEWLGPMPAPMEKKADRYRAQLWIQGQRRILQDFLQQWLPEVVKLPQANRIRWSIDVDPQQTL